jgi:magnesium chelatase family protein
MTSVREGRTECKALLKAAMQQLHMSARAYHVQKQRFCLTIFVGILRILRLARNIADLAGSDELQTTHLAEAIQYQPRS